MITFGIWRACLDIFRKGNPRYTGKKAWKLFNNYDHEQALSNRYEEL